jgi:hypothetical protein
MNREINEAFNGIQGDAIKLYHILAKAGFESTQEVFDAALHLYEKVGIFIESVEDADANLDPETSNLPDMDELFSDDPVSKYVHAAIAYAQSEGSVEAEEALKVAALEVAESQKELAEDDCEEDCCLECCACDLAEMDLHEFIDYTEEDYAAQVMANMELIEEELKGKTEFSQADLYLIRYYLKRQPYNADFTVEGLSDRGLELAWKRIQWVKNIR